MDKIEACVTVNAHNISLAIHKTSWKHLPCFAHTVNLIVSGGLSVIQNTLNKIKAIVEYMHRSTVAAEKLKATQQQMGLPELKPPPPETQESLVLGDFDEQVGGLVTRTGSSAEAVLEIRSYSEEPLLARSSSPLL